MDEDEYTIPDGFAPNAWRSDGPVNRASRLAAKMTAVLDELGEEARDVRCLVILNTESGGATAVHGYLGENVVAAAVTDAIAFVDAALKTSSKPSRIVIKPL